MREIVSIGPRRATRLAVALGCAVALVLLVGCQTPAKDSSATAKEPPKTSSTSNQPEKAPPAAKPAPAPKTAAAKSEESDNLARAVDKGEQPSDVDRDALAELIRQRITEARKAQEQKPTQPVEQKASEQTPAEQKAAPSQNLSSANKQRAADKAPASPPPTAQEPPAATGRQREPKTPAEPTKPAQPEPATKDKGCGATAGGTDALTPPAPDAPQPKLVVATPKVTIEPVWQGSPAVFKWEVKNEGAGPLNVRVKGG